MSVFWAVAALFRKGRRRRVVATAFALLLCCSAHAEQRKSPVELGARVKSVDRCRSQLENVYQTALDTHAYGLAGETKYLDPEMIEWGLSFDESGVVGRWVNGSLRANEALFDTVWGGVYAHSKGGDWKQPCYTKLLARQSAMIALYAAAYRSSGIAEYRALAEKTADYVERFLKGPTGSYCTSQGACGSDAGVERKYYQRGDVERRKRGVPALDTRVYIGENADFVRAVSELYAVSNDERFKEMALGGARMLVAAEKGDSSASVGSRVRYSRERIAVGAAFLSLYSATGDKEWLSRARAALDGVVRKSSAGDGLGFSEDDRIEISASLARLSNMMYHYVRHTGYRDAARRALESAVPDRCEDIGARDAARLLLAERELGEPPPYVALIGDPEQSSARELWGVMLSRSPSYVLREQFSSASEAGVASDVRYPKLPKPAAFVCAEKRCSLPIFDPTELRERIAEMTTGTRDASHAGS